MPIVMEQGVSIEKTLDSAPAAAEGQREKKTPGGGFVNEKEFSDAQSR